VEPAVGTDIARIVAAISDGSGWRRRSKRHDQRCRRRCLPLPSLPQRRPAGVATQARRADFRKMAVIRPVSPGAAWRRHLGVVFAASSSKRRMRSSQDLCNGPGRIIPTRRRTDKDRTAPGEGNRSPPGQDPANPRFGTGGVRVMIAIRPGGHPSGRTTGSQWLAFFTLEITP